LDPCSPERLSQKRKGKAPGGRLLQPPGAGNWAPVNDLFFKPAGDK